MKNKILFMLVGIVVIVLTAFTVSVNATTLSSTFSEADKAYHAILELNWSQNEIAERVDTLIRKHYKDSFPSYFGGMYISDDSTSLIIQIVKENIPKENSDEYSIYKEIISMGSSVTVEYVNNSFAELNDVNDRIVEHLTSKEKEFANLRAIHTDVINNVVVVELADISEKQQENFKNDFSNARDIDYKLINFIQGEEYSSFVNLFPGEAIRVADGGLCSMGFRTRRNGRNGFITAGHCGFVGDVVPTGRFTFSQFVHNQRLDYAFVETHAWLTPTNNLAFTAPGITRLAVLNNATPFYTVGTAIAKAGHATRYTTGRINALNVTVNYSNPAVTIHGLVRSNLRAAAGDSGGVVFIPRTDANGGSFPIGIVSGGHSFLWVNTMFFTGIANMPMWVTSGRY